MKNMFTTFFVLLVILNFIQYSETAAINKNQRKSLQKLSESKECSDDLHRLCGRVSVTDDIALLNCLQDNDEVIKSISKDCQHFLWDYKRNLTTSDLLDKMTKNHCTNDLNAIEECKTTDLGHRVPCLLDHKFEVKEKMCLLFLNEIGIVIFSDYHLIYKFVEKCKPEVKKFTCGRITRPKTALRDGEDDDNDNEAQPDSLAEYISSQADTLDCLMENFRNTSKQCQHEIIRIAELQADDYHLNRPLYLACREDRENLCGDVKAGDGRVYDCLMKHKMSAEMSKACQVQLTRKQQIESIDVKADYPLYKNCKSDIEKYKCKELADKEHNEFFHISSVLICLSDAERSGAGIDPHCRSEINTRRSEMLQDYKISPEVVMACKEDAVAKCDADKKDPGEVLHCMMNLAKPDEANPNGRINMKCRNALVEFLKIANPTENLMHFDPAMARSCGSTINTVCGHLIEDKKKTFQCLLKNLESPEMTQDCREKMESILFFVSLDVTISDSVVEACSADSKKYCRVDSKPQSSRDIGLHRTLEYHCLWELYKRDRIRMNLAEESGKAEAVNRTLSSNCANEMFILIQAQASKVELDPLVFEPCVDDLAKFCNNRNAKGRRHECLQEHMGDLSKLCRRAVISFSEMESADVRFNKIFRQACKPVAESLCPNIDKSSQIMDCLMKQKFHEGMTQECRAAVEHFQIVSLEEYKINYRFVGHCKEDINKLCQKELEQEDENGNPRPVTKTEIVSCLSNAVLVGLTKNGKSPLTDQCQKQFSFELLQRSESIKLDPKLAKMCGDDIRRFCTQERTENIPHCLREHQDDLKDSCHRLMFRRERVEAFNEAEFDGEFVRACRSMIKLYCKDESSEKVFECLHTHIMRSREEDYEFDEKCRHVVMSRLERQMHDVRLNPGLMDDCGSDIEKHCDINNLKSMSPENNQIEFEGKIIGCLKAAFVNDSRAIKPKCRKRILDIIVEANTYLILDPQLKKRCRQDIDVLCKKELTQHNVDNIGAVHNCLKMNFMKQHVKSAICQKEIHRLLRESGADIHVDYELFEACENAIMTICHSEYMGNGRKIACLTERLKQEDKEKKPKGDKTKFDDTNSALGKKCATLLRDRSKMWSYVQGSGAADVQSLSELYHQVTKSSTRTYLLSMFVLAILMFIILGIFCGRITKRVPVDMKNK